MGHPQASVCGPFRNPTTQKSSPDPAKHTNPPPHHHGNAVPPVLDGRRSKPSQTWNSDPLGPRESEFQVSRQSTGWLSNNRKFQSSSSLFGSKNNHKRYLLIDRTDQGQTWNLDPLVPRGSEFQVIAPSIRQSKRLCTAKGCSAI